MTQQSIITDKRACEKCDYELRGLRVGGNCPECGTPIRAKRKSFGAREGNLTDAPPRYIRGLRLGFTLMAGAIALSIFGAVAGTMSFALGFIAALAASALWLVGVFQISKPRPPEFAEREEPILDGERMRTIVRACGAVWVFYVLFAGGHDALVLAAAKGGGNGILEGLMLGLRVLAGVGAYLSLIPMCIYVSEMAFWMSDDAGGWRLRGAAWAMAVFGTLQLLMQGMAAMGADFLMLFVFWCAVIVLIADVVFGLAIIGCARMAGYALSYQAQIEGRQERITQRLNDRTSRGGTVSGDMECRGCGYNLRGLPNGGKCPECGTSYADITPMAIIPPRQRRPEDEAPIELDETGEAQVIVSREVSIDPDARARAQGERARISPADEPGRGGTPEIKRSEDGDDDAIPFADEEPDR